MPDIVITFPKCIQCIHDYSVLLILWLQTGSMQLVSSVLFCSIVHSTAN